MDSGGWIGEAADAFWSSVGDVLKKLDEAAAAFQEAVFGLRTYTAVLRQAQADVCRALSLIDQADAESRLWAAKNADTVIQNVTAPYTAVVAPVSPDDPGEALRRQAHALITEAKDRVAAAARHAAERLDMAADHAPHKPGLPVGEELLKEGWSEESAAGVRTRLETFRREIESLGEVPPEEQRPLGMVRALDFWGVQRGGLVEELARFEHDVRRT